MRIYSTSAGHQLNKLPLSEYFSEPIEKVCILGCFFALAEDHEAGLVYSIYLFLTFAVSQFRVGKKDLH